MSLETTIDIIWRKFWAAKIAILASVFTGAESLVSMGFELPGSKVMPVWLRGLIYMTVISGAFLLRWMATRGQKDDA